MRSTDISINTTLEQIAVKARSLEDRRREESLKPRQCLDSAPNPFIIERGLELITTVQRKIMFTVLLSYTSKLQRTLLCFANNPQTPAEVLNYMSENCASVVAKAIALNRNTVAHTLCRLAKHTDPEVRAAVSENSHTPLTTIVDLCKDDNVEVRYSIAENPLLPSPIISLLINDENPYVSCRASKTLSRLEREQQLISNARTKSLKS